MPSRYLLRRAAVCAACLGATVAVGASSASAATLQSEHIFGNGSSLQAVAQNGGTDATGTVWAGWTNTWGSTAADHKTLNCTSGPSFPSPCTATYTSTSSGTGLAEFGDAAGTPVACGGTAVAGALDQACDTTADNGATNGFGAPILDAWAGSDDPPPTTDLSNAATAAGGGVQQLTVPVAQAPVAILLSLPSDITLNSSDTLFKLKNTLLQAIYDPNGKGVDNIKGSGLCTGGDKGSAGTWCGLLVQADYKPITSGTPTASQFLYTGTDNGGTITDFVRASASGTTFTQKGFLNESGDANYASLVNDNDVWPAGLPVQDCSTAGSCSGGFGASSGGGTLVKNTAFFPGSVGYANLADAAEAQLSTNGGTTITGFTNAPHMINWVAGQTVPNPHQVLYVDLQANYNPTCTSSCASPKYTLPETSDGVANVYTGTNLNINGSGGTPGSGTSVGDWTVPSTLTGTWSPTLPADPNVFTDSGNHGLYADVAGTYDLAWTRYDASGSNLIGSTGYLSTAQANAAGASAKSYLQYLTGAGQSNLVSGKQYYARLPTPIDTDAKAAAADITP
jgi:hypothetical protein